MEGGGRSGGGRKEITTYGVSFLTETGRGGMWVIYSVSQLIDVIFFLLEILK